MGGRSVSAIVENCEPCLAKGIAVAIRPRHAEYRADGWRYWYRCPACRHRWGVTRPDERGDEHVPHWLYRIYGTENDLLYIGITKNLAARLGSHARNGHWSFEIRDVRAEWYPDLPTADAAETAAIRAEKPRHNEAKSRDRIPRRAPVDA
jgi:predicted GIY-YIG superfamily endonuclease